MSPPNCSRCNARPVEGCEGRGFHYIDETTTRACKNIYALQLKQHLGPEISSVRHVVQSPLLQLGDSGRPAKVDRTKDNLVLVGCKWRNLLPHLKWALGVKGLLFPYRIATDWDIKTVFVGSESYAQRSKKRRDDMQTFNSLGDFVGRDLQLVIIRLGFLGHKNNAGAGSLKEALLLRKSHNKPTWLVIDPDYPWNFTHNEDVEYFVKSNYKQLKVPPADPGMNIMLEEEVTGISVTDHTEDPEDVLEENKPTKAINIDDIVNEFDTSATSVDADADVEEEEVSVNVPPVPDDGDIVLSLPGDNSPKKWKKGGRRR